MKYLSRSLFFNKLQQLYLKRDSGTLAFFTELHWTTASATFNEFSVMSEA